MKGSTIISETILEAAGVLISFILIALVVNVVFTQQTANTYESGFQSIVRDISISIDRVAASSGSMYIQQNLTKGLKADLVIDYKSVVLKYGKGAVQNYFIADMRSGPYSFSNPTTLCIAKSFNDNRIIITNTSCVCNSKDDVCDPACIVKNVCDAKCMNDASGACNSICSEAYPAVCDKNCYTNEYSGVCEKNCIKDGEADGICSPDCNNVKKGVCDIDCYNKYSNGETGYCDIDCPPSSKITTVEGVKTKISDGKCYSGCANYTRKDGILVLKYDGVCDSDCNAENSLICDPDCTNSEPCKTKCTKEGEKAVKYSCCDGLVACPGTDICAKNKPLACCSNGICEGRPDTTNGWGPGNKTQWETFYTCSQDCRVNPNTKPSSCQAGGSFSNSVCYRTLTDNQGRFIGFEPVWRNGIIEVCNEEIIKFLDRRNWDIKEVIKTWKDPTSTPEAWAWDAARYDDACNRMQKASVTVSSNEKYTSNIYRCCAISGASCGTAEYTPQCSGVGFCIDHSTAVLSVLRTLGVPAKNVYSVFMLAPNSAHAWVLFKCNQTEANNLKPLECEGNWGKWLSIDATAHSVVPIDQTSYSTICLMWNDQGIYAKTEGKIDSSRGYAYDPSIPRSSSADPSLCIYDKLCKEQFGVECVVP